MFTPSREQARRFLADAWSKHQAGSALSDLEQLAAQIIVAHPEYHRFLQGTEPLLSDELSTAAGTSNPFLHLSLHLAVAEQLAIDQPSGIKSEFERLRTSGLNAHAALHAIVECLGDIMWESQRTGNAPDALSYLQCLRNRY